MRRRKEERESRAERSIEERRIQEQRRFWPMKTWEG